MQTILSIAIDALAYGMALFIICIGLFEAWKLNRRVPMVLEGPFQAAPPEPAV